MADLSQASPATVSRCGMVYIDDFVLTYSELVSSYFQQLPLPQSLQQVMLNSTVSFLPSIFAFLSKTPSPIATTPIQLTFKMLKFFQILLTPSLVEALKNVKYPCLSQIRATRSSRRKS